MSWEKAHFYDTFCCCCCGKWGKGKPPADFSSSFTLSFFSLLFSLSHHHDHDDDDDDSLVFFKAKFMDAFCVIEHHIVVQLRSWIKREIATKKLQQTLHCESTTTYEHDTIFYFSFTSNIKNISSQSQQTVQVKISIDFCSLILIFFFVYSLLILLRLSRV